jgi:ferredoxin-fold anticodon binding domain-containing protein
LKLLFIGYVKTISWQNVLLDKLGVSSSSKLSQLKLSWELLEELKLSKLQVEKVEFWLLNIKSLFKFLLVVISVIPVGIDIELLLSKIRF